MTRKQKKARAKQRRADELRRASASNQTQAQRISELEARLASTQAAFERAEAGRVQIARNVVQDAQERNREFVRRYGASGPATRPADPAFPGQGPEERSLMQQFREGLLPGTIRDAMDVVARQTRPVRPNMQNIRPPSWLNTPTDSEIEEQEQAELAPTGETQVFDIERGGLSPVVPVRREPLYDSEVLPPDAVRSALTVIPETFRPRQIHDESRESLFRTGVYVRLLPAESLRGDIAAMFQKCYGRIALALGLDGDRKVKVWAGKMLDSQDFLFWDKKYVEIIPVPFKPPLTAGMSVIVARPGRPTEQGEFGGFTADGLTLTRILSESMPSRIAREYLWPLPLLSWGQPPVPEEPIEDASLPWKRGAL